VPKKVVGLRFPAERGTFGGLVPDTQWTTDSSSLCAHRTQPIRRSRGVTRLRVKIGAEEGHVVEDGVLQDGVVVWEWQRDSEGEGRANGENGRGEDGKEEVTERGEKEKNEVSGK